MTEMKVERLGIPDQICNILIEKINRGELKPGDRIPSENDLCEQLGVSRVSLKIALQKLNTLGITETRIGDGTYVCEFNMKPYFSTLIKNNILDLDFKQLNEFRVMLEYSIMRLAIVKNDNQEYIEQLEAIYHKMYASLKSNDFLEYHKQHYLFHQCICDMSGNQLFILLYYAMGDLLFEIYQKNSEAVWATSERETSLSHHREILEVFKSHDVQKCLQIQDELLTDEALNKK